MQDLYHQQYCMGLRDQGLARIIGIGLSMFGLGFRFEVR